jgi:transposase
MKSYMATIQAKISRGCKYWYIVESRRVNGKPRPIVLAYLGKAEDLLKKLQKGNTPEGFCLKSYSHGLVSALYDKASALDIAAIIDSHAFSPRKYVAAKPIRNGLSVGQTLVLAAIGRACRPTSKQSWANWVSSTSLEYILKRDLGNLDSQHFWDHMDCIDEDSIEKIETQILQQVWTLYKPETDTLLFDTTNFFTYIDSSNNRCKVAKRGKNKQKRIDLRQVGLALVVTKRDHIPLFHQTYKGNQSDYTTFKGAVKKIKKRIISLGLNYDNHTLVFDKGMSSKANFDLIDHLEAHYVTSLKLSNHKRLVSEFKKKGKNIKLNGKEFKAYRTTQRIIGKRRTVVVYFSESFYEGVLNGVMDSIKKRQKALDVLLIKMKTTKRKISIEKREQQIKKIISKKFMGIIKWEISTESTLKYWIDPQKFEEMKENLGVKILVTDRTHWRTPEIIKAYVDQSAVEEEFKNMKNPMHLAFRPQFHWTDQKIKVHYLICIVAHLLTRLLYKEAKERMGFNHCLDRLLEDLGGIRLSAFAKVTNAEKKSRKQAAITPLYMVEETKRNVERILINGFKITA